MEPELNVQREILERKRDLLRAQAFEHELNAICNEAQTSLAGLEEKRDLVKAIVQNKKNAKQLYAAARALQKKLDELPEPESSEEKEHEHHT